MQFEGRKRNGVVCLPESVGNECTWRTIYFPESVVSDSLIFAFNSIYVSVTVKILYVTRELLTFTKF